MISSEERVRFRTMLVELYPTASDARRVLSEAHFDLARVDLTGKPINFWEGILEEASKQDGIDHILDVARREYPNYKFYVWTRVLEQMRALIERVEEYLDRYENPGSGMAYGGVVAPLTSVLLSGVNTMTGPPLYPEFDKQTAETLLVEIEHADSPYAQKAQKLKLLRKQLLKFQSDPRISVPELRADVVTAVRALLSEARTILDS